MTGHVPFERNQRLRLRPRGLDREIPADVLVVHAETLWLGLPGPNLGLEDHHLWPGVDLSFWRDGARHVAKSTTVLAFDLDAGRLHLERPRATTITQRRRTFRETVEIPVQIAPVEKGPNTADLRPQEVITQDLGGGGLCLQSKAPLNLCIDDEIQLELDLPGQTVKARGRVRWSELVDNGMSRVGVAFTRISEREQDTVYGFLFNLQRNRLRAS